MNRRAFFLAGILFELVAVFGLFLPYIFLLQSGTPITLRTVPIDPRSIFRGDYVILGYEAGEGLPMTETYGDVVYAVLEKGGDVYERVRFSDTKPELTEGQICLRGRTEYQRATFPDIAQYFVEEGTGTEWEQAQNAHRLLVDAVVNDDCKAAIKGLRLGPEVPEDELPEWMQPPLFLEEPPTKPIPAPVEATP